VRKHLVITSMAATLMTTSVLAQTGQSAPGTATDGAVTAPIPLQYLTENRPDLWRASKLAGLNVYNEQNEKVGDIREVLVNRQGQAEAIVIGVGGFLGVGERDVAVPFGSLKWVEQRSTVVAVPGAEATAPVTAGPSYGTPPAGANAPDAVPNGRIATAPPGPGRSASDTDSTGGHPAATERDLDRAGPARAVLAGASRDLLKQAPAFHPEQ
jgi:sporulation protein YlmC with PRC-barrel domain